MLRKATKRVMATFVILSLAAGGFLLFWNPLVNALAQRFLLVAVSEKLGGTASLRGIRTSLFPPRFEIDGLEVALKDGPLRAFSVREILIEPGIGPAFLGEIRLERIVVRDPTFKLDLLQAGKGGKKDESGPFRIPRAADLIRLKIESLQVEGAKLALALPGRNLEVEISQGNATYQSGGDSETWSWRGRGEIVRDARRLALDEVLVTVERDQDALTVRDFRLNGLGLDVALNGAAYPKADFTVRAEVDVARVLAAGKDLGFLAAPPDAAGRTVLTAKATGAWEKMSVTGQLDGEALVFAGRRLDRLHATFVGDRQAIREVRARVQSRGIAIDARATGVARGRPGDFEIIAQDMPFEDIETGWIDPAVKVPTLKGPVTLRARGKLGFAPFVLAGDYDVTSPKLRLHFEGGLGTFLPIQFTNVRARGALGWSRERNFFLDAGEVNLDGVQGKYKFDFPRDGSVAATWAGNVSEAGRLFEPAMQVSGSGQVNGGITTTPDDFEVSIHLGLDNFRLAQRENVPLSGSLLFRSGSTLLKDFELEGYKANASFDAEFKSEGPGGHLRAKLRDFDLGAVADVTARLYPIVGGVEGTGQGEIALTNFNTGIDGTIRLESKSARWDGIAIDDVAATAEFSGGKIRFPEGRIANADGFKATIGGGVGETDYAGLTLNATKLPLDFFGLPRAVLQLASHADAKVRLDGSIDDPTVVSSLQLFRRREPEGFAWAGIASTEGPLSRLAWSVNLDAGSLDASGTVNALDAADLEAKIVLAKYSLAPFFKDVPSTLTASAYLKGDLRRAESFDGQFVVDAFEIRNPAQDFRLRAPVTFALADGAIRPTRFGFDGGKDRLEAVLGMDVGGKLNGDVKGSLPLSVLTMFRTGVARAEGALAIDVRFGGAADSGLQMAGSFSAVDALIQFKNFPLDLTRANIRGTLDQNVLYVDEMSSSVGEGSARASGQVVFPSEREPEGRVSISGYVDKASLRYPAWLPVNASGTVALTGPLARPTLRGDFTVHQARYEDEWDWKSKILTFGSAGAAARIHKAEEENIYFDLRFVTQGDRFLLKNNIAEGKLRGDARLVGSDRKIGLLGKVEVIQGSVEFLDNRFELTSGVVTFDRADEIHPVFDLNAKTRVQQVDIFLDIRSEGDDIFAFLSSQPVKDETNIIALLTLGVDTDELLTQREGSGNVSSSVLPGVLSAPVQSKLQRGLKETRVLDSLQFVPFFSEQTQTNGLRMIVGKELFPKVKLLYSTDLFNVSSENTVRLEQGFNEHVSLQGSVRDNRQNQNEELDFGLDFEFRFDF